MPQSFKTSFLYPQFAVKMYQEMSVQLVLLHIQFNNIKEFKSVDKLERDGRR